LGPRLRLGGQHGARRYGDRQRQRFHGASMPQTSDIVAAVIERTIATTTHGRYLVVPADGPRARLLVGFHGYGEGAEVHLRRLESIPRDFADWKLIAIQGLNRFYERRTEQVVASWMTRQDRDLAIADNLAYVSAVVDAEWPETSETRGAVFAGFSQ